MRTHRLSQLLFGAAIVAASAFGTAPVAPAFAQDAPAGEEEEGPKDGYIYDLDKLGVEVSLVPKGSWKHDHWSPWDLKAKTTKGDVEALVWTTDFQIPIEEADLEAWGEVYINKAGERSVSEANVVASSVKADVHGGNAGMFEIEGKSKDGGAVVMYAAAIPVDGFVMHVATMSLASKKAAATKALGEIVDALKINKAAQELAWGSEIANPENLTAKLTDYWRPALKSETDARNRAVKSVGQALRGCWVALHPQAPGTTELFLVCHDKNTSFPVVNALTFADQEAELRDKWLGDAETGTSFEASGRSGWQWSQQVGKREIAVMSIPMDGGLMKASAIAAAGKSGPAVSAAQATLGAASFAAPEPPPMDEYFRYLIRYEPTSPLILGPAIGGIILFIGILGLIVFGLRRQNAQARAEMNSI